MTQNNNIAITDISGTEYEKKFNIINVDPSLPNSLRRIILSEIEVYGFKNNTTDIVIKENTTKYHNEFLMHRLSLIPLNITETNFDVNNYKFVIDVKNNINKNDFYVTSENFEVYIKNEDDTWELQPELQNKYFKKNELSGDYIYICPLFPFSSNDGEQLIVECYPSICTAKNYGGHTAVSKGVTYPMVNIQLGHEELERQLLEKGITNKKEIDIETKLFYNTDIYRFYDKNEQNEPYKFTFDIESIGIMSVNAIFANALEILTINMERVKKNILNNAINFSQSEETEFESYDLKLENESQTIGYLLQSHLYKYYRYIEGDKNNNETEYKLKYIGYDQGHPLEKITTIRYSLSDTTNENVNKIEILKDMTTKTIDNIISMIQDLQKQWSKLTKNKK